MTGIATAFRHLSPLMANTLGDSADHPGQGQTIELRRYCSLAVAEEAVPVTGLKLVHDTSAGAVTLDLALETTESYPLTGSLLAGCAVTVGAITYRITAPSSPTGNLITVAIPPLVADASEGDAVTLTPYVPYALAGCMVSHKGMWDALLPGVRTLTTVIIPQEVIAAAGVPGGVQLEDHLVLEDGTGGRVSALPASSAGFVKVTYGP